MPGQLGTDGSNAIFSRAAFFISYTIYDVMATRHVRLFGSSLLLKEDTFFSRYHVS